MLTMLLAVDRRKNTHRWQGKFHFFCLNSVSQSTFTCSNSNQHEYDFETIHNIDAYTTDTCWTFREAMKSWNMCVQYWLAINVYKRFPSKNFRLARWGKFISPIEIIRPFHTFQNSCNTSSICTMAWSLSRILFLYFRSSILSADWRYLQ